MAGHKDPKTKDDRGLNSTESMFISSTLGRFHSVGSYKLRLLSVLCCHAFIYLFIYLSIKGALKSKVEKQITRGSLSRGGVL